MMSSEKVRWGILGAGRISARLVDDGGRAANAAVVAVGSRDRDRAAEFASRFGIPRVHGSYEALLADPEIDAVYIGTPNSLHHPQTMAALAAGKHVLCEKPYSRHPEQVVEAFDAAAAAGLVLMEAFMWRHTPQVRRFVELLPEIGELQSIRASFSFVLTNEGDVRLDPALDGGSLMDVGCYCVSGSRLVAGAEPSAVFGVRPSRRRAWTGPSPVCCGFPRAPSPRSSPASRPTIVRSRRSAASGTCCCATPGWARTAASGSAIARSRSRPTTPTAWSWRT